MTMLLAPPKAKGLGRSCLGRPTGRRCVAQATCPLGLLQRGFLACSRASADAAALARPKAVALRTSSSSAP
mgnify:CR=1 FL=1